MRLRSPEASKGYSDVHCFQEFGFNRVWGSTSGLGNQLQLWDPEQDILDFFIFPSRLGVFS